MKPSAMLIKTGFGEEQAWEVKRQRGRESGEQRFRWRNWRGDLGTETSEPEPAEEEPADAGYLLLPLNSSFLVHSCTLARRLGSL